MADPLHKFRLGGTFEAARATPLHDPSVRVFHSYRHPLQETG